MEQVLLDIIVLAVSKEIWSDPVLSLATTGCGGHRSNQRSADGSCPGFILNNNWRNQINL
jgi:hypothetical protein